MSFLSSLFGGQEEKQQTQDFDLILSQLKIWGIVTNAKTSLEDKEQLNEKLNQYLAFRQLSEVLDNVPHDQLEKVISYKGCEEHRELIENIKHDCWKHECIEKFIDLFENGKADPNVKSIKLYQERDELGINHITLL